MTNDELLAKWGIGCKWLEIHEQMTGTNKNCLGETYDHRIYLLALARLENIEGEMQKRKMIYG